MEFNGEFLWFVYLMLFVAAAAIFIFATARQHRRHSALTDGRLCRACGQSHPPFAQFCRRCGAKL